jgi:hypothetical protein
LTLRQKCTVRMELMGLYVPAGAEWLPDMRAELLAFPHGKHDDIVDPLGLCGQLMEKFAPGRAPSKPDTWNNVYSPPYEVWDGKTL